MQYRSFTLDQFQVDAISSIEKGSSVIVSAPTGSGKTLIADYLIEKKLKEGKRIVYTAPIKALSNQKFKEFKSLFGEENIGLMTGDIVINPSAPVLIMTTEIYRNMVLIGDSSVQEVNAVVFDEIHYISDVERGYVWEESIIFSRPEVRFLCLSATIPNASEFADWVSSIKKHKVDTIVHTKRVVPLEHMFYDVDLGITTLEAIRDIAEVPDYNYVMRRKGKRAPKIPFPDHVELIKDLGEKLPCLYFIFSREDSMEKAFELARKKPFGFSPKISSIVREKLQNAPSEINKINATRILRETLPCHIGFHHAGILPILKDLVEELFSQGLLKVLYATETFAVGINMPAKTVCFDSFRKFDGITTRFLHTKEYFQMAGRAGRRGIDTKGFVVTMVPRLGFDYNKIKRITSNDIEPLTSQFKLGVNTVLNLIKRHTDEEIDIILEQSFLSYQQKKKGYSRIMHARYENILSHLIKMGYVKNAQDAFEHTRNSAHGISKCVKNRELTPKGEFASRIYSDEILTSEIFATDFSTRLTEHDIMMILALISYEPKDKDKFYKRNRTPAAKELKEALEKIHQTRKDRRFRYIFELAAIVEPCYQKLGFFNAVEMTSMLEGDIIRLFSQMLDRLRQVRRASTDIDLTQKLDHASDRIRLFLSKVVMY